MESHGLWRPQKSANPVEGVPTKILGRATLMRFTRDTYKFLKRRTCKIINSHHRWSWLASAKSESYILTFRLFTFWCCNFLSRSAQTNNSGFNCPENIFSCVSWVHYIQAMYSKEKCTIACVLLRRRNRTSLFLWHWWKELQDSKNWEKNLE